MTINWPGGVLLEDIDHDDPRWLARRQEFVGASEIAGMMGLGKYGSPAQVYLNKVGAVVDIDNNNMALGRWAEPYILDHVVKRLGVLLAPAMGGGEDQGTYAHKDERRMTCTPDGQFVLAVNAKPIVIEIKRTDARGAKEEWEAMQAFAAGNGPIPAGTYAEQGYLQVQDAMEVLDVDEAYLCACIGDRASLHLAAGLAVTDEEVRIIHIKRDRALGALMVKQVGAFWKRYVDAKVCPDTTDDDLEALRRHWPVADDGTTERRHDRAGLVRKMQHYKAKASAMKKKADACEARLRSEMGTCEAWDIGDGLTLTAKTTHRKESTRTVKASSFRTLRVAKPKAKRGNS